VPGRLTVLIPCKNERRNIVACIRSAKQIADEVLVADSLSTDDTLDLVRAEGGCRIIEREHIDFTDFKNWAIPQASCPWVLVLDADERVTPELAQEIRELLAGDPPCDSYDIRRNTFFLGKRVRFSGYQHDAVRRLFRRDHCRYEEGRSVHEFLMTPSGKVGKLKGRLDHFTTVDLTHFCAKQNDYSAKMATDRWRRGKRPSFLRTMLYGPLRFLQLYVLRLGFLDGFAGLVVCGVGAYYAFLKDAKLWALSLPQEEETPRVEKQPMRRAA
jgi:glycosyltransferase involved in cell wall biosynthesis